MARPTKAQRRAKNRAKQEKLNRERAGQQSKPVEPPAPPVVVPEAAKIPEPPVDNGSADQKRSDQSDNRPPATRAENVMAIFTALLFVLAVAQAVAMFKQNSIMREQMTQVDATIEQMRLEQRAWLGVSDIDSVGFTEGMEHVATVKVHNSGNTPAIIVNYGGLFYLLDPDKQLPEQSGTGAHAGIPDNMNVAVPPNGDAELIVPVMEITSKSVYDDVMSGRKILYVIGNVTYLDSAGQHRHTWWCYILDPKRKGWLRDAKNNGMD